MACTAGNETNTSRGWRGLSLALTETKPDTGIPASMMNHHKIYVQKALSSLTDLGVFESYGAQRAFQPPLSMNR